MSHASAEALPATSTETPVRPLPSEHTQVAPYSWLRRHMGAVAAITPALSAAVSWGIGMLGGLDPVKAFGQLGAPMGFVVLLVMALVWTYTVHIPRRDEGAEKTRQAQLADAAEDRTLFRETMTSVTGRLEDVAYRLGSVEQTLVRLGRRTSRPPVDDDDLTPPEVPHGRRAGA